MTGYGALRAATGKGGSRLRVGGRLCTGFSPYGHDDDPPTLPAVARASRAGS